MGAGCRMPTQRLKTMIVTAAGTDMRFGELAALAPAAISLGRPGVTFSSSTRSLRLV